MTSKVYEYYLEKVVNCPKIERSRANSPCTSVIVDSWVNLLGWGNPNSEIVFIGINPFYNADAHQWHKTPQGRTPLEHARIRSGEGASHARHFSYHRRILRELITINQDFERAFSDNLKDFAFYTEVAFCPSTDQAKLNNCILAKCFEANVKQFIVNSGFQVIVALGKIPSKICVESLIGNQAASDLTEYHGKVFQLPNENKYLITSYHPNAFGKWNRSAVSGIIADLYNNKNKLRA